MTKWIAKIFTPIQSETDSSQYHFLSTLINFFCLSFFSLLFKVCLNISGSINLGLEAYFIFDHGLIKDDSQEEKGEAAARCIAWRTASLSG